MTLEDSIHAFRLRLFRRAEEFGSVSAACREAGIARSLFYQLRPCYRRYGPGGLHPTRRRGLGTRGQRFGLVEQHSAGCADLLTKRTRRALRKARSTPSRRHVEAETVGELVCLDRFYISKLKRVGRVREITDCGAVSSFALAQLFLGDPNSEVADAFLDALVGHFERAGWPVERVPSKPG